QAKVRSVEPEGFHIREHRVGRRVVLAISGEIDLSTAPQLSEAIVSADGCAELWIDLSDVSFMDSTGISALAAARQASHDKRVAFAVICPSGPVRRVLELSGMDRYLDLYPDRSAANCGNGPARD